MKSNPQSFLSLLLALAGAATWTAPSFALRSVSPGQVPEVIAGLEESLQKEAPQEETTGYGLRDFKFGEAMQVLKRHVRRTRGKTSVVFWHAGPVGLSGPRRLNPAEIGEQLSLTLRESPAGTVIFESLDSRGRETLHVIPSGLPHSRVRRSSGLPQGARLLPKQSGLLPPVTVVSSDSDAVVVEGVFTSPKSWSLSWEELERDYDSMAPLSPAAGLEEAGRIVWKGALVDLPAWVKDQVGAWQDQGVRRIHLGFPHSIPKEGRKGVEGRALVSVEIPIRQRETVMNQLSLLLLDEDVEQTPYQVIVEGRQVIIGPVLDAGLEEERVNAAWRAYYRALSWDALRKDWPVARVGPNLGWDRWRLVLALRDTGFKTHDALFQEVARRAAAENLPISQAEANYLHEAIGGAIKAGLEEQAAAEPAQSAPLRWAIPRFAFQSGDSDTHVMGAGFSPSGEAVTVAWSDRTVQTLDPVTGVPVGSFRIPRGWPISNAVFSPDGKIAAFLRGSGVHVVDLDLGREGTVSTRSLKNFKGAVTTVAFSPEGRLLVLAEENGPLHLLDTPSFQEVGALKTETDAGSATHALAFSPDGRMLASAISQTGSLETLICLWKLRENSLGRMLIGPASLVRQMRVEGAQVSALAFSPDGKTLAAGESRHIVLWDIETGSARRRLQPATAGFVDAVAFSPDGTLLVSAHHTEPRGITSVCGWEPVTGRRLFTLSGHQASAPTVLFSPDGKTLLTGGASPPYTKVPRPLDLWDIDRIQEMAAAPGGGMGRLLEVLADPRAAFAERVRAAQILQGLGLFLPQSLRQAFDDLPSAGAQQAALLATHLYRIGSFTMEQLADELEELRRSETEERKKAGDDKDISGLELHTAIGYDSPEGHLVQALLEVMMRVPRNLDRSGSVRVATVFEDGGLEIQTLPSYSPDTNARVWELWEEVLEAEGVPFVLTPQSKLVDDSWVHQNFNGSLRGIAMENALYRWMAVEADRDLAWGMERNFTLSQPGGYVAWIIRPPVESKLGGYRTEVVGMVYIESDIMPNPWTVPPDRAAKRRYRRALFRGVYDLVRAFRRRRNNLELWVQQTADLSPRAVNATAALGWTHHEERESELRAFHRSLVTPSADGMSGSKVLGILRETLDAKGITLQPYFLSEVERDPALWRQIYRFLLNGEKVAALQPSPEGAVRPLGWGLDLEVRGQEASLEIPMGYPMEPEPFEAYVHFVDRYLRPQVEQWNSPAFLLRGDGVYFLNPLTYLWNMVPNLWVPDGLGEFLQDRRLAVAFLVPAQDREEWWKGLHRLLDPRNLWGNIPPEWHGGEFSGSVPMSVPPGKPVGSLRGYVAKTRRDPDDPERKRVIPASFVIRQDALSPAPAGLEEVEAFVRRHPDQIPNIPRGTTHLLTLPLGSRVRFYRPDSLAGDVDPFLAEEKKNLPASLDVVPEPVPSSADAFRAPAVLFWDPLLEDLPYQSPVPVVRHWAGQPLKGLPRFIALALAGRLDAAQVQLLTVWAFEQEGRQILVFAVQA